MSLEGVFRGVVVKTPSCGCHTSRKQHLNDMVFAGLRIVSLGCSPTPHTFQFTIIQ
jgi:hypothetical protein